MKRWHLATFVVWTWATMSACDSGKFWGDTAKSTQESHIIAGGDDATNSLTGKGEPDKGGKDPEKPQDNKGGDHGKGDPNQNPGQNDPGQNPGQGPGHSQPLHVGYDIQGKYRSCNIPPKDLACTEIFGPGDQYAIDCAKAGGKALMCGCHVYLCSKKI